MITIDTNIVVRYLIKDDEIQVKLAIELFKNNRCFILKTVILETVWVLSSKQGYALAWDVIVSRIQHLLKLPAVDIEDLNSIILALHWYGLGMDFADALHLAASLQTEQFVTFDKRTVNKANAININQVVSLLEVKDNWNIYSAIRCADERRRIIRINSNDVLRISAHPMTSASYRVGIFLKL